MVVRNRLNCFEGARLRLGRCTRTGQETPGGVDSTKLVSKMGKQSVLDALVSLVAEKGTEGLSVRAVAARAGVSIGTVQYHFPTKVDMLLGAMNLISGASQATVDAVVNIENPVERLHRIIDFLVPEDASDRVSRVWLAFASHAAYDESLRAKHEDMWERMRAGILRTLIAANPKLSPSEMKEKAAEFLALVDGLTLTILAEPSRRDFAATARRIAHRRADEIVNAG